MASHTEELEGPTTGIHNYVLGVFGEREEKRGRLATDVSSGPIFLTKKTKKNLNLKPRLKTYFNENREVLDSQ